MGGSPRIYIDAPNTNVEFSAEVFVQNSVEIAHLIARSNHQDRPDGFGGYYLYVNMKDQKMYFKKEISHGNKNDNKQPQGYSSRLAEKSISFEKGKWYPMKITVKNDGNNVKVEGDFNGTKNSFTDDGTLQCGNDMGTYPNTKPYTTQAKWCFIRTNKPDGVKYRNVSIRSI